MTAAVQKSSEAFRTISEVAEWLDVPQHVLRFWETKFNAVKPLKRGGGRRYYRPDDIDLLRGIRSLLYGDGLTIKGVQKILKEQGARYVMEVGRGSASLISNLRVPNLHAVVTEKALVAIVPSMDESSEPEAAALAAAELPYESEPDVGLTESERDRFTALLDELSELKSRLSAVRRRSSFS